MKKKILSTIFVIVIAAVAVTNIVKNKNSHHTEEGNCDRRTKDANGTCRRPQRCKYEYNKIEGSKR